MLVFSLFSDAKMSSIIGEQTFVQPNKIATYKALSYSKIIEDYGLIFCGGWGNWAKGLPLVFSIVLYCNELNKWRWGESPNCKSDNTSSSMRIHRILLQYNKICPFIFFYPVLPNFVKICPTWTQNGIIYL